MVDDLLYVGNIKNLVGLKFVCLTVPRLPI